MDQGKEFQLRDYYAEDGSYGTELVSIWKYPELVVHRSVNDHPELQIPLKKVGE